MCVTLRIVADTVLAIYYDDHFYHKGTHTMIRTADVHKKYINTLYHDRDMQKEVRTGFIWIHSEKTAQKGDV